MSGCYYFHKFMCGLWICFHFIDKFKRDDAIPDLWYKLANSEFPVAFFTHTNLLIKIFDSVFSLDCVSSENTNAARILSIGRKLTSAAKVRPVVNGFSICQFMCGFVRNSNVDRVKISFLLSVFPFFILCIATTIYVPGFYW